MKSETNFASRLKCLRKEHSLTQLDLAKKLGIVRTAVTNYETERTMPDPNTLNKLSNIFGVSVDYLLGISDNKEKSTVQAKNISRAAQLDDEFPEGVDVLMRAKEELTPKQRKKMIELMNMFIDSLEND